MLLRLPLQAAEPKLLAQAAALKSLAVAVLVQAAVLKSPAVAEKVASSVVVLLAVLSSLLAILAAVLLPVATAVSELQSVLADCSERFSRASQAVTLLLVTRVAAPAEALLLPLLLLLQLQ
jgi:hypothetical protein